MYMVGSWANNCGLTVAGGHVGMRRRSGPYTTEDTNQGVEHTTMIPGYNSTCPAHECTCPCQARPSEFHTCSATGRAHLYTQHPALYTYALLVTSDIILFSITLFLFGWPNLGMYVCILNTYICMLNIYACVLTWFGLTWAYRVHARYAYLSPQQVNCRLGLVVPQ